MSNKWVLASYIARNNYFIFLLYDNCHHAEGHMELHVSVSHKLKKCSLELFMSKNTYSLSNIQVFTQTSTLAAPGQLILLFDLSIIQINKNL